MKKSLFISLFIAFVVFCSSAYATVLTNNFFIKDVFEKEGLKMKYSGVIKFNTSSNSNYESDIDFDLYLASFFIEEVTYKGIKYRGHELFGYTFPKELLSRINIETIVRYNNFSTTITTDISSFDKIKYKLTSTEVKNIKKETSNPKRDFDRGLGFRLKLIETNRVEFPINRTVVYDIIKAIDSNKALKTKEAEEKEYFRLLTEGNILLNENNFREALISYTLAKKYTQDPAYVNGKIDIVDSYLNKNKTKYRWINREGEKSVSLDQKKKVNNRIDFAADFASEADKKIYSEKETEANNLLAKNEYDKAILTLREAKEFTTNKKVVDAKIATVEKFKEKALGISGEVKISKKEKSKKKRKARVEDSVKKKSEKKTFVEVEIDSQLTYPELLKKGSEFLGKKEYIKSKAYFEAARDKTEKKETVNKILTSVNKLADSEAVSKGYTTTKAKVIVKTTSKEVFKTKRNLKPIKETVTTPKAIQKKTSDPETDTVTETKAPTLDKGINLADKAELLKAEFGEGDYRKGFVKYKRDEQAVLDAFDRVLIPYGKYEILRYRAGFANIRVKDSVALKTIECTGKNDEYSWSARIYQNPWIETVVDKNGDFVDDLNKRVEIYVVDNVSLLPWEEVPQRIKDAYKDPNQYTGTDFVSAYNLWEHENAKRPDIVARRNEIQSFKDASKNEAYRGANKCKQQVAKSIEEVYTYFKDLGYEIVVKY